MMPDGRECADGHLIDALPVVMIVEASAVINQVEDFVPPQHVRIARSAVHIRYERVEPDHTRSKFAIRNITRGGIIHQRSRKVVESKVESTASFQEAADLIIRLVTAEHW